MTKSPHRQRIRLAGITLGLAVAVSYSLVHAEGEPASVASPPIVFSGQLSDAGSPVNGSRSIGINLWRSSSKTAVADRLCETSPVVVEVVDSRFQVALSTECTRLLSTHSAVWYELIVDDQAFPLSRMGAVPFAARSAHDSADGSRLRHVRRTFRGGDGFQTATESLGILDTTRSEYCTPTETVEGGVVKTRCLPPCLASSPFYEKQCDVGLGYCYFPPSFSDSSCKTPLSTTGGAYYDGPGPEVDGSHYVCDADADGRIHGIYAQGGVSAVSRFVPVHGGQWQCQERHAWFRTFGAELALSGFVELTPEVEPTVSCRLACGDDGHLYLDSVGLTYLVEVRAADAGSTVSFSLNGWDGAVGTPDLINLGYPTDNPQPDAIRQPGGRQLGLCTNEGGAPGCNSSCEQLGLNTFKLHGGGSSSATLHVTCPVAF